MNRKELKNRGLAVLKTHYWIIVLIMAFTSFIGVENASSFGSLKRALSRESLLDSDEISTSIMDERFGGVADVFQYITSGFGADKVWDSATKLKDNITESGKKIGDSLSNGILEGKDSLIDGVKNLKDGLTDVKDSVSRVASQIDGGALESSYIGPVEVGKTQGVFAEIVNSLTSGKLFNRIFAGIASIVKSDNAASIIIIGLMILLSVFIWYFVFNIFKVVSIRFVLESRTYETVPIRRVFYLFRSGRWIQTAWVLFSTTIITILWSLTLVGGIIKAYQYMLVPYIMAENPGISAKEARKLSTDMMNRHKWEAFKLGVSFLGWKVLSFFTFGILELFFLNAYEAATFAEYYTELRTQIKKKKKSVPEAELLNDRFLYVKADDKHIDEAYADIKSLVDEEMPVPSEMKGVAGFIAKNFGLVLFASREEKKLCEYEEHQMKIKTKQAVFEKKIYPFRLFPAYRKTILHLIKPPKIEYLHYGRRYSIWSIVLMFFCFSFIGWLWEVGLHLYEDGVFVNRGFLRGPIVPIYGCGSILILIFLNRFRNRPLLEFGSILVLSAIMEYSTATVLDNMYHTQWWDYTGYFLNIQGRICAEGLLLFAVLGCLVVYFLGPVCDNCFRKWRLRYVAPLCIMLLLIFMADIVYSSNNLNTGAGITEYPDQHPETVQESGT
ncbi:MAG: DUF975 family protein [Lachnospiraceae bacterium]|nr:DUF975 family protein [Lachnospiraceae bacterium]